MQYVLVAINLPVRNLFKQFLYRAPADRPDLAAGWRVLVPFGRNEVEGFVVRTYTEDEARHRMEADGAKMGLEDIREVLAVLGEEPWFDAEMLATAHWLARYYMCTDAEAMRLFIPGKSSLRRRTVYQDGKAVARTWEERLKPRTVLSYRLTEAGRQALSDGQVPERSRKQRDALTLLEKAADASPADVTVGEAAAAGISAEVLRTLARKGWAEKASRRVLRNSYDRPEERRETLVLTAEQKDAVTRLKDALHGENMRNSCCAASRAAARRKSTCARPTRHCGRGNRCWSWYRKSR